MKFYGRPDGKAVVWIRPYKPAEEIVDAEYPYWLTTGRIIEHWHTSTMTKNVKELVQAIEAMAEIHPRDAEKLGISTGDRVRLTSRRGSGVFRAEVVDEKSRPGLVFVHMHDHNRMSNVLTIDAVDPVSKQPEFKICSIRIEKA